MIREYFLKKIKNLLKVGPVVALLGPRQCGKTTLAKMYAENQPDVHFFDLEDPETLAQFEAPKITLEPLNGLIIIDEIQRRPELFPLLRVLVDQKKQRKFLILGSASQALLQQSSESLAGRIAFIDLPPFVLPEVDNMQKLWLRGGYPRSYLATSWQESVTWRQNYVKTFLERDIPNLGIRVPANTLRRFWTMLAHYHGQLFNASEIGHALGFSHTTIRHYLDLLTDLFMVRQLQPWITNIKKRQVKTPKIYFCDSGLFHILLNIQSEKGIFTNPKLGASWEGFALEQMLYIDELDPSNCYFWSIHNGPEIDLFTFDKNGDCVGYEFKYSDAPKLTDSMHKAIEILDLKKLTIIYPGTGRYLLDKKVEVRGLAHIEKK